MLELIPLSLLVMYLVPFLIAAARSHDLLIPILITNLLFGWTGIGWFFVLFWALFTPVGGTHSPGRPSSQTR